MHIGSHAHIYNMHVGYEYLFFIISTNHGAPPDSRASIRWRKQRRWCHIRTLHLLTISPTSASAFLGRRTSSYSVKGFWWRIYQEIHQGAPVRCQNPGGTFADVVASAEGQANGGAGMLDGKSYAIVSSYTLISAWHIWHLYGHHLRGFRLISGNQIALFSYWFGQRLITKINRRVIRRYYFIVFVNNPLYRKINHDCMNDTRWITENSSHMKRISSISRETRTSSYLTQRSVCCRDLNTSSSVSGPGPLCHLTMVHLSG